MCYYIGGLYLPMNKYYTSGHASSNMMHPKLFTKHVLYISCYRPISIMPNDGGCNLEMWQMSFTSMIIVISLISYCAGQWKSGYAYVMSVNIRYFCPAMLMIFVTRGIYQTMHTMFYGVHVSET